MAKYCYENDIPILGICAGRHTMVRALGGKVLKIDKPNIHKSSEDYVHKILINKNSLLYNMIEKEEIMVNSRHANRAAELGPLEIGALSEDGIIESVEAKNKKFYLAVQFHPESLYKIDLNMNKIFKYFINVCQKNKSI